MLVVVRAACGYFSRAYCGSISNSWVRPLLANMSTCRCSKSSTSCLSSSIWLSADISDLGSCLVNITIPPQCFDIHLFLPSNFLSIRFASVGSTPTDSYVKPLGSLPVAPKRLAASRLALFGLYVT